MAWRAHTALHVNLASSSSSSPRLFRTDSYGSVVGEDAEQPEGGGMNRARSVSSNMLAVESGVVASAEEVWTPIYSESSYTPTEEDVGCALRIVVTAMYTNQPGVRLTGPVVALTEAVLGAPHAPPKRLQMPTQNDKYAASSASLGPRFRLVSYNVLAELYATRQVNSLLYYF